MYYLGIDMGSTSTKVIVLNENKEIHHAAGSGAAEWRKCICTE